MLQASCRSLAKMAVVFAVEVWFVEFDHHLGILLSRWSVVPSSKLSGDGSRLPHFRSPNRVYHAFSFCDSAESGVALEGRSLLELPAASVCWPVAASSISLIWLCGRR